MSLKLSRLLPDSKNEKLKNTFKEKTRTPTYYSTIRSHISPILLPEILRHIFSYLTRREVRQCVLRVCKLWNSLAWDIVPCVNTWYEATASSSLSLVEHFLNSGTDTLRCVGPKGPPKKLTAKESNQRQMKWLLLGTILEGLPKLKLMRIKTLTMVGNVSLETSLYPFLPIFCGLQTLRLEGFSADVVSLDTILRLCPNITKLYVSSLNVSSNPSRTLDIEYERLPLPVLRLRSLTLWNWKIKITTLHQLLKQCPYLIELKLIKLDFLPASGNHTTDEHSILLLEVAASCPRIRSLHFSMSNQLLSKDLFTHAMRTFPNLDTWSTEISDVESWMYKYIQHNMLLTLTTLEFTRSTQSRSMNNAGEGLHHFLCEAPNLLHLRAEGVEFGADIVCVLRDLLPSRKSIDDNTSTITSTDDVAFKRIWACRNLRTLHLTFTWNRFSPLDSPVKSRALFAFIVNVCPKISDLNICHLDGLYLPIKGGLCLLSGLGDLVKLRICAYIETDPKTLIKDLEWFRTDGKATPWSQMTGVQKLMWRKNLGKVRDAGRSTVVDRQYRPPTKRVSGRPQSRMTLEPDDQLIYDIQKASSLDNVAKVLDTLRRNDMPCWPLLERLDIIEPLHPSKLEVVQSGIRGLRPGLVYDPMDE